MEKQTQIQKQIEQTVTNGRGYKPFVDENPLAINYSIAGVIDELSRKYFGSDALIIDYQAPFTSAKSLSMPAPKRAKNSKYDSPFDLKQALGQMEVEQAKAEGNTATAQALKEDLKDIAKLRKALQEFGVEDSVSWKTLNDRLSERRAGREISDVYSRSLLDFYKDQAMGHSIILEITDGSGCFGGKKVNDYAGLYHLLFHETSIPGEIRFDERAKTSVKAPKMFVEPENKSCGFFIKDLGGK